MWGSFSWNNIWKEVFINYYLIIIFSPFDYKKCKIVSVTSNVQAIPVHPIITPCFEEDLFKLFDSHKDLMMRIKKCALVLPDDDFIPPFFKVYFLFILFF